VGVVHPDLGIGPLRCLGCVHAHAGNEHHEMVPGVRAVYGDGTCGVHDGSAVASITLSYAPCVGVAPRIFGLFRRFWL
jgi:hypothetical protein